MYDGRKARLLLYDFSKLSIKLLSRSHQLFILEIANKIFFSLIINSFRTLFKNTMLRFANWGLIWEAIVYFSHYLS